MLKTTLTRKVRHPNSKQKRVRLIILISDKTDFKIRKIIRSKDTLLND
jgi:hypothetical protein